MDRQILVLIVIMVVTLVFFRANDYMNNRKFCVSIVTIIMTCFSGFRSWWMGDLIKYYTLYRNCNAEDGMSKVFEDYTNIGIRVFFRTMGCMGISYDICIFIIAAFSAITLGILVYKYSPSPYWSYLIYIAMGFYLFTYSGLKQTIAMGFVVLAVIQIFESKPIRFLFWVFIAGIFHAPAFILIIAYPVAKKKIDAKYFFMLIMTVVLIYVFKNQIITWFTEAYYEEEKLYTVTKTIGGRAVMMVFIIILGLILRPAQEGDKIYCQVLNLMVIAALIQYFSIYDNVFTRLADYYYQFIVLFMPMILESGDHQLAMNPHPLYRIRCYNKEIYLIAGVAITVFALWFYNSTITGSAFLQEFKFFWEIDPYSLYGV